MQGYPSDAEWTQSRVASLPKPWADALLAAWHATDAKDHRAANVNLRETTDALQTLRLPLDASDHEIVEAGKQMADRCLEFEAVYRGMGFPCGREAMNRLARGQSVIPPGPEVEDGPAVARMCDPVWWRSQLRVAHARAVERAAIRLGHVNQRRQIYCSDLTVKRRIQQNARNAQSMEDTTMENEHGDQFTLAELADKGTANRAIKRAELMTRIAGFEHIANQLGHQGLFITITCPSRFHRWRTVRKVNVIENPRFDPTTDPHQGSQYLGKVWARIRAALARKGVHLYGFRVAEPQHDGTPHWHLLVFCSPEHEQIVRDTVHQYAMQDSPNERGATLHRYDIKKMDTARGTAAGYIAKYIAKNIDGYGVGKDLYGNDAITVSLRVEAWASTWGIRQFQQIGGAPVGPWRELRRVESIPTDAPQFLQDAHRAVNKLATIEGKAKPSASWAHYQNAQGGVYMGRAYRVRVAMEPQQGLNKYQEPKPDKPAGVTTLEWQTLCPNHAAGGLMTERTPGYFIRSKRHVWTPVPRHARRADSAFRAHRAPWTCVNNCTWDQELTASGTTNLRSPPLDRWHPPRITYDLVRPPETTP